MVEVARVEILHGCYEVTNDGLVNEVRVSPDEVGELLSGDVTAGHEWLYPSRSMQSTMPHHGTTTAPSQPKVGSTVAMNS